MKLKLFPKIALILISLAVLPVLVVGWQTYSLNKEYLETNILELHTNLANSLSNRIDHYLNGLVNEIRTFIEALRLQGTISAQPLQAFLNTNDEFISIGFIHSNGKELMKVTNPTYPEEAKLMDRSQSGAYLSFAAQNSGKDPYFEPKFSFSFQDRDPTLAIVFPNNPENFSQGAFYIVVSLSELWDKIISEGAGVGGGGGREAFVVDEKGVLIAHTQNPDLALKNTSYKDHPIVAEALQLQSIGSKEYKDKKGEEYVGSYSRMGTTGWISIIQQPKQTAYNAINEIRKSALRIVLISIVVAALLAFLLAKGISRPIFTLIEGARKVARGEFDHHVEVKTGDEMSALARTFNEMVKELQRYNALQVDRIIEEKMKTEAVIFSIADGIIMTDQEGSIQLFNDQAVRVFGLTNGAKTDAQGAEKTELIGRNLLALIRSPQVKETLQQLIAQPGTSGPKEILVSNNNFELHYQLSSALVHTAHSNKNIGVVTVVHDVTLERELDQMKENFLHSITHDLRNPMTSIMGFLKFLVDGTAGPINEQQQQMLVTMERASVRLLGMINDILDVAKIEAGKLEIDLAPVQISALVEDLDKLYQPLAQRKSVQLKVELPANHQSLVVQGESSQIERVMSNLVANALKFTALDGYVILSLEDFADRVQITVADNGPGIPQDYLEKVFDKFQQMRGQKRGGTGLGLTICKYFVELHKGKIWVESEVGKGSRFIFWIPKHLVRLESGEIVCQETAV